MKLTIVLPALNEELAIGSTIERMLAAREHIISTSPIKEVEVIVVSDGSTDRTAEIASSFREVRVIVFEQNRGYGAAIKKGFAEGSGEIVGFLDADGTCDPKFFAHLCDALTRERADVAIGSRMGPESRMPKIRRLGNRIYALILSALSNKVVSDTASGMRIIRRSALRHIYPLPDGLHFTPAMSARVLMDEQLRIVEQPMSYEERIGESKLHVLRDGVRFFQTIFHMSLMWRPAKCFFALGMFCLGLMTALALHPIETWLREGKLQEDMVYRLLFCSLAGSVASTLVSAAAVCGQLQQLWDTRQRTISFVAAALDRFYSFRSFAVVAGLSTVLCGWLVGEGVWTRLTAGYVALHWSRVVLAGLVAFSVFQMLATVLMSNLVRFHIARRLMQADALLSGPAESVISAKAIMAAEVPSRTDPIRAPIISATA
jgi:glycosyltransferase involved in cell wall biosynthesis